MDIESNLQEFADKFAEYAEVNGRDREALAQHKAKSLAIALYQATPVADAAEISAKVESLGWRVKRKFSGRPKKGEDSKAALRRMQASIIAARIQHRHYVASGFLPAVQQLGGTVAQERTFPNKRGRVTFSSDGPVKIIEIVNYTPGVVKMEEKYHFVEQAIQSEIDDMDVYIRQHQEQAAPILQDLGHPRK